MPERKIGNTESGDKTRDGGGPLSHGKQWLLGIGIGEYVELPNLTNAVKDVKDIIKTLTEDYGLSRLNTITLFDEEATQENLIDELDQLAERVGKDDNLLIYFAGHGHLNKVTDMGYWIPHDAKKGKTSLYIGNSTIRDYLKAIKSKHTLLIVDSCFSGSLFVRGANRSSTALHELETIPSRWAICSGRHDEEVSDGNPGGNSPFAQSILDALSGNTNQLLNVAKLADRVVEQTRANYSQLPEGNPIQGVGHKGGQYIFHLKANESKFWEDCQRKNTIRDYGQYLGQFPEGKHITEALARTKELEDEDEAAWRVAESSGTVIALHSYIHRDSTGRYIKEAQEKISAVGIRKKVPAFLFLSRRRIIVGFVVLLLVIIVPPWGALWENVWLDQLPPVPVLAPVPVAVLLPKIDKGAVQGSASRQWDGFLQAFEHYAVNETDRHVHHFNYPFGPGDDKNGIMRQINDWYGEGIRTFIITMSGAVLQIKPAFIKWAQTLPANDRPVLVSTIASAPEIADLGNGIIRNYFRSESEADMISTFIESVNPSKVGIFFVNDTYGLSAKEQIVRRINSALSSADVVTLPIGIRTESAQIERLVEEFVAKRLDGENTVAVIIGYGETIRLSLESLKKSAVFRGEILVGPNFTEEVSQPNFGSEDREFVSRIHAITTTAPRDPQKDSRGVVFQFSYLTLSTALECKEKRGIDDFWNCFKTSDYMSFSSKYLPEVEFTAGGESRVELRISSYEDW